MADRVGVSPATVQRIWDARGVEPHRVETIEDYVRVTNANPNP